MEARLRADQAAPDAVRALRALNHYVETCGLEPGLLELVKTRASQINGCAFYLHMHTKDARARGETEERLFLLDAWRESPLYSERERAALAWTEALTLIAKTGAPDADFEELRRQFSDREIVDLTVAVGMINTWNRLAVGLRFVHPMQRERAA
jgi:AhpD family alkylhydroperoxidase